MDEILRRAGATAAQAGLAVLTAAGTDLLDVDVWQTASLAAAAAAVSVLHRSAQVWLGRGPAGTEAATR